MQTLTKTERAMEMLSLFDLPKYKEKVVIAGKLSMSVRQVYRAWDKVSAIRRERLDYVKQLEKWRAYCMWLYNLFTEKWFPDPGKKFTRTEKKLLGKIEGELKEIEKGPQ